MKNKDIKLLPIRCQSHDQLPIDAHYQNFPKFQIITQDQLEKGHFDIKIPIFIEMECGPYVKRRRND